MAGGKGGSQTTATNFTPEMERGIADAINLARNSARAYMPIQGATLAAKTGGMLAGDQGLNSSRAALGLPGITSSLPEAKNYNGVMGYSSYPMFQDEMARAEQNYPDLFQKIKSLQEDPFGSNAVSSPTVSLPTDVGAATGVMGASMREDDPFPNHGKQPDMFDGTMFEKGDTSFDFTYSPVMDFVDWISGGYDSPEQTQADKDYYKDPDSAFNTPGGWHPTD